jgi:(1->4)-alpha-D-glucan 1-alpha-D-glucosylmutase
VLLLRDHSNWTPSDEYRECRQQFVGKFQQLTSPVMAKGVEDTALYNFNRLVSLNEVGGDPSKFGRRPQQLHDFFKNRATKGRNGLSPLSTHDTKRSEDVRARINVLSELPKEWERTVQRWRRLNRQWKVEVDEGVMAPDDNEEYFLYQTLVGAWPVNDGSTECDTGFVKRIQDYLTKSLREAKVHSSWIHPDTKYDEAVSTFVASILRKEISAEFQSDLRAFLERVDRIARINSLSQSLIRCLAPGIPDTYQGTESWDYSLVDPDNRHPVDYASLTRTLDSLAESKRGEPGFCSDQVERVLHSAAAKLFVVSHALELRKRYADLFQSGEYLPLKTSGPDENHLFSFLMADSQKAMLVAVPRLVAGLAARHGWDGSFPKLPIDATLLLPDGYFRRSWRNVFTGKVCRIEDGHLATSRLFAGCPLALLVTEPNQDS